MKFIITLPCGVDTCITNEMFASVWSYEYEFKKKRNILQFRKTSIDS